MKLATVAGEIFVTVANFIVDWLSLPLPSKFKMLTI